MSYHRPRFRHPERPKNALGLTVEAYEGTISTLCAGCGHDSISAAIIQAMWQSNIGPHRVAKMSGIGCSSKSPAYFLGRAHGFNSLHGRMPSVATGANAANRDLLYIGVSGDGDTASIGLGQFAHIIRRNVNMVYIVENNGCYGLTKGQDSATADEGSISKKGQANPYEPVDLVTLAVELGVSFVARSFSGDKAQLIPLLKSAIAHKGFALIDVISPCVTFNNNQGSTKSYEYAREHNESGVVLDFIPVRQEITAQYEDGMTEPVTLHDGSVIHLMKAQSKFDPADRDQALEALAAAHGEDKILTGLIYLNTDAPDLHATKSTPTTPLNILTRDELCPGNAALAEVNQNLR